MTEISNSSKPNSNKVAPKDVFGTANVYEVVDLTEAGTVKLSHVQRVLTAGMVICFALAGWHFAGNPASEASVAESTSPVPPVPAVSSELGAADASGLATTSIEEIRLGQRVVGKNPLRHETQSPSNIAPENWRAVQLSMYLGDVPYDLNSLRSLDWLKATAAAPGRTVHMQLPEMGLNGPALVEAIAPCPPIEPDDGTGRQIVTGLMIHRAENILDISITGLDEPLGVTTTHPIWSETRQHFVKAGQLEVGEHLRSTTGHLAEVTHITPHRGPPQNVYNLEVNAEHVYQVGQSGLLVHNDCGDIAVIGNQADTAVAKNWAGHEILDIPDPDWTPEVNQDWIKGIIDNQQTVYKASPENAKTLINAKTGEARVYAQELEQLRNAGYVDVDNLLLPPSFGAP